SEPAPARRQRQPRTVRWHHRGRLASHPRRHPRRTPARAATTRFAPFTVGAPVKTRTRHVVCWVEAGFDALDVASFCQVLSEAGSTWNWRAYRIEFVSRTGGLIASNAQLELNTAPMAAAQPDVVIVASGRQATPAEMP